MVAWGVQIIICGPALEARVYQGPYNHQGGRGERVSITLETQLPSRQAGADRCKLVNTDAAINTVGNTDSVAGSSTPV